METSRVDGVEAPLHFKTRRPHGLVGPLHVGLELLPVLQFQGRRRDDALLVVGQADGVSRVARAARVVNGAGRVPNVAHLDLDAGGVGHSNGRIDVDDHLRSVTNPSVWVAGDALTGPGQLSPLATYEGQIVGESRRAGDLNVNITKAKKLDNMRASGRDENVIITPHQKLTIEEALGWIEDDELLEVTPVDLRLRKKVLSQSFRKR